MKKGALEAEATEAAPCWPANNAVLESESTGLKWNLVGGCEGGGGTKLDTSVIRSELKGEKREQGKKGGSAGGSVCGAKS